MTLDKFLEELYEITNSNYFKNKLFNKANMNYTQLPDDNTTRKNRPGKVRAENKKMRIL